MVTVQRSTAAWLARPLASLHLLLAVFGLLTTLGLVMVLSASSVESYAQGGSLYAVFGRQVGFCAAGLVLFGVGMRVPMTWLRRLAPVLLLIAVGLLVGVLVPGLGVALGGARKWYVIAGVSFQPAEPAKVALALWAAHMLTVRRHRLHLWREAISPVLPVAVVMLILVVLQPDLGTAVSIGIVVIAALFYAGVPARLMGALVGGGLLGVVILGLTSGYRSSRITSFLAPGTDQLGAAYQSTQALYSLADGGLLGTGLGQGAAKWSYLPNAANDFIFAVIGEELGLVGAVAVLGLFAALAWVGLRIAARNTDPWVKTLTATLTTWLVAQAGINIGYVVGVLPVTGIPLPLISSGGTALVVTMFVFGILANAARSEPAAAAALHTTGSRGLTRHFYRRRQEGPEPHRAERPVTRRSTPKTT